MVLPYLKDYSLYILVLSMVDVLVPLKFKVIFLKSMVYSFFDLSSFTMSIFQTYL
jgi:hypothetical protein